MKAIMKALHKVVILKEIIEPTIDPISGMEISSDSDKNDKTKKGQVVSLGEDVPKDEKGNCVLAIGDFVLYNKHQASNLTDLGIKYKMMNYEDLIAKV